MFENEELVLDGIKTGQYNLYLGAGATHGCKNILNKKLPLGNDLLDELKKKFAKDAQSLYQMASIIPERELNAVFQNMFNTSTLSDAIKTLPNFIWRGIFTLNIDNAIELAYKQNTSPKQKLMPVNFDDSFITENDMSNLQLIHLHGCVDRPSSGYIFNANQYIKNIKGNNTWMTVFADLFSSYAFIMSGLSFNEHDVDYYMSFRSNVTQKTGSYPSILVEPYPTDYTRKICEEHGFVLVESSFEAFIDFLLQKIPNVPTVYDLNVQNDNILKKLDDKFRLRFFSDFDHISVNENTTSEISPFDYGFEPEMLDIQSDKDIKRAITDDILNEILSIKKQKYGNLILLTGKYLNGKTTSVLRLLHSISRKDFYVFRLKSMRGFNLDNTLKCLEKIDKICVLYIDNIAEYIHQVNELILRNKNVIVIGTERNYRIEHIKKILSSNFKEYNCDYVSTDESERLINKYFKIGKISNKDVLYNKELLEKHTIGEQVCLILDNYDPIENKIEDFFSLNGKEDDKLSILSVAICCYCYKVGVNYYVIRSILPQKYDLNNLFKIETPFKLEFNPDDKDYVLPRNKLYSRKLVETYIKKDPETVRQLYIKIVKNISRSVNRETINKHTPESKLLARMLDVDRNVKFFFGEYIEIFMKEIQPSCEWNSRYWEQRALGLISIDIDTAIDYSKQAVAIEYHPYTLTTLAKVLFAKMNIVTKDNKSTFFEFAVQNCLNAMREESRRHMESIHPLITLIHGVNSYKKEFNNSPLTKELSNSIYAAIDTYEQEIKLQEYEIKQLEVVKNFIF